MSTEVVEKWWVVFTTKGWHRWAFFTRSNARHCYCFTNRNDGLIEVFDPQRDRLFTYAYAGWSYGHVKHALKAGHQVFVVDVPEKPYCPDTPFHDIKRSFVMTCASLVAYRIGVQEAIVTPQGLRSALIRLGARRLDLDEIERD